MKEKSVRHRDSVMEVSNGSVSVPKAERRVTIADPELSSPLDSPSSLYSRANAQMFERPLLRNANEHQADQHSALLAKPKPSVLKSALKNIDSEPESPSSACSCSTPNARKDSTADDRVNDVAGTSDLVSRPKTPQDHISVPVAADSSSSLESLYYPAPRLIAKSNLVQNYSHRDLTPVLQRQPTPKSLDTRADSPSSVYSRSVSGVARDANHVDGGIHEDTDQSACSSNVSKTLPPQQNQLSIHALGTPFTSSPTSLY